MGKADIKELRSLDPDIGGLSLYQLLKSNHIKAGIDDIKRLQRSYSERQGIIRCLKYQSLAKFMNYIDAQALLRHCSGAETVTVGYGDTPCRITATISPTQKRQDITFRTRRYSIPMTLQPHMMMRTLRQGYRDMSKRAGNMHPRSPAVQDPCDGCITKMIITLYAPYGRLMNSSKNHAA